MAKDDTCPVCGQGISVPQHRYERPQIIETEDDLIEILCSRTPNGEQRQVYRSRENTWHFTYGSERPHTIDRRLITALVGSGVLRRVYSDTGDAYWLGQTIDMDATMAKRRQTGDRRAVVYASP